MAILLMNGLPDRIITVLRDYLPAELDLIDASMADGITTPDIANEDYHNWDVPVIHEYPACVIRTVSSTPVEVLPTLMGERIDSLNRVDVLFTDIHSDSGQEAATLLKYMHRRIAAAVRVLCVTKEALQTVADSTRFVELVTWAGEAVYGPAEEQEEGGIVRTATLPITVRRRESRT